MSRRIPYGLAVLLVACLLREGADALGQGPQPKPPLWTHAFDLKVRKYGEPQFSDKTKTFGVEVFKDANNDNGVYIGETGALSVARGFGTIPAPVPKSQSPAWLHGLDLKVRKAGEKEFDKNTKKWSVEVFRDENSGMLIYISETGAVAVVAGEAPTPGAKAKAPDWLHGLDLKVRKGGQKDFDPNTKVYGIEVFRDGNNGNLIYICETGTLTVVPGGNSLKAPTPTPREPVWTHGLDLKCRKFGEAEFSDKTQVFGVEVFRDANTGSVIYICQDGSVSAVPGKQ